MRVLAVSGSERSLDGLLALIKEGGIDAYACSSGAEARRRVLDEEWDEVVINYPLQDESGAELARMIGEETGAVCIMLSRSENWRAASRRCASKARRNASSPGLRD